MATDKTRERILAAAGEVFAENGFRAATVRDICRAADVNLASVNYHFRDKEGLYLETVRFARKTRVEEAPLPHWPADTSTATKLTGFIHTLLTRMVGLEEAPWPVKLLFREILNPTEACKDLVEEYFRPHFELLLEILGEVLPADTPRHQREQIGFSIVGQCLYYRVAPTIVTMMVGKDALSEHYSVEQLAGHISRMTLMSLGLLPPFTVPTEASVLSKKVTQHV